MKSKLTIHLMFTLSPHSYFYVATDGFVVPEPIRDLIQAHLADFQACTGELQQFSFYCWTPQGVQHRTVALPAAVSYSHAHV